MQIDWILILTFIAAVAAAASAVFSFCNVRQTKRIIDETKKDREMMYDPGYMLMGEHKNGNKEVLIIILARGYNVAEKPVIRIEAIEPSPVQSIEWRWTRLNIGGFGWMTKNAIKFEKDKDFKRIAVEIEYTNILGTTIRRKAEQEADSLGSPIKFEKIK